MLKSMAGAAIQDFGTNVRSRSGQNCIKISVHLCGVPLLRTNHLSHNASFTVNDIGFGNHYGAVVQRDFLGGPARGLKTHWMSFQELLVASTVFIDANCKDHTAARTNPRLKTVQVRHFFYTGATVRCPKIEHDDFPSKLRESSLPTLNSEWEVFSLFPGNARFALSIARHCEHIQYSRNKCYDRPICKSSPDVLCGHKRTPLISARTRQILSFPAVRSNRDEKRFQLLDKRGSR